MMHDIGIEIINLVKSFLSSDGKTNIIIDNISFNVNRNELLCIVGPSGCGKTTLLRIILELCEKDSGQVIFHSNNNYFKTAYIQQESQLLPWRTLKQNALLGAELRKNGMNKTIIERIQNRIVEYKLDGYEASLPSQISGGMKQRVDIIRALESRPEFLFCDEPFSAIDFVTRLQLSSKFKQMTMTYNTTTLFVTHNIEEAIYLGDRVIVLSKSPSKIVNIYEPNKANKTLNPVDYRQTQEFSELFSRIWQDLKNE